jgi:hypothetical protein
MMRVWLAVVTVLLMSCGAPDGTSGAGQQPVTLTGTSSLLEFTVTPQAAVHQGDNAFTLHLANHAGGQPVSQAQLQLTWRMPAHGHAGAGTVSIIQDTNGDYRVSGVAFSMAGSWEVTWQATSGGVVDSAVFPYDVP